MMAAVTIGTTPIRSTDHLYSGPPGRLAMMPMTRADMRLLLQQCLCSATPTATWRVSSAGQLVGL